MAAYRSRVWSAAWLAVPCLLFASESAIGGEKALAPRPAAGVYPGTHWETRRPEEVGLGKSVV